MITDVAIFIAINAVYLAAMFFAMALAFAIVMGGVYLCIGVWMYLTNARYRGDVNYLVIKALRNAGHYVGNVFKFLTWPLRKLGHFLSTPARAMRADTVAVPTTEDTTMTTTGITGNDGSTWERVEAALHGDNVATA